MYQVQHYRKIQSAVHLSNLASHNMREKIYDKDANEIGNPQQDEKWYEPDRAKLNKYDDLKKGSDILVKRHNRIKTANLKRKPQKNASLAIEGIFSASPEFNKSWINSKQDMKAWKEYLDKSYEWASKTFGKDNILQSSFHMDEKTPHMHLVMVPIKTDSTGQNKYSSSTFLGGRKGLSTLHNEYHKSVGKDLGLERGLVGSRDKHKNLDELKKEDIERDKSLTGREKKVGEREKNIAPATKKLEEKEREVNYKLRSFQVNDIGKINLDIDKSDKNFLGKYTSKDGDLVTRDFDKYKYYEIAVKLHEVLKDTNSRVEVLKAKSDLVIKDNNKFSKDLKETKKELHMYKFATPDKLRSIADNREYNESINLNRGHGIGD